MIFNHLFAISPLDGRYSEKLENLRPLFSEYGLMRYRLLVEIRWLEWLAANPEIKEVPAFSSHTQSRLNEIITQFDANEAQRIKTIEAQTKHDVKAIEYYMKEKTQNHPDLHNVLEFIHFGCTSEDINNLAYALIMQNARKDLISPLQTQLIQTAAHLAEQYAKLPMLSRTHGQPASPTTVGKEFSVFAARWQRAVNQFNRVDILGKFNGAVGNYNAHTAAYPDIDWLKQSQNFVESFGLTFNPYTAQTEPHDFLAELFHALIRFNTILLDFNRDIWGYISLGYFQQKQVEGEVGSSTMPHKINPIDFENSEGNLGMANAILDHLANKLPISRWQRDLSDSTVMRNIGVGVAHSILAYQSTLAGLKKLSINPQRLNQDLSQNQEVIAEAIQTVMRRYGIPEPYEKLKELTRGKAVDQQTLLAFVSTLNLPDSAKKQLAELTAQTYLGKAVELAQSIAQFID